MSNAVTVLEAAQIMKIHHNTVRKLIKQGKLEAYNTGGKLFINLLSIPAFMRQGYETKKDGE